MKEMYFFINKNITTAHLRYEPQSLQQLLTNDIVAIKNKTMHCCQNMFEFKDTEADKCFNEGRRVVFLHKCNVFTSFHGGGWRT